jgi:hypothetical protein
LQKFLSRLFARLMKSWNWVLLIATAIAIKWVSLYPGWVEKNYTYGIYPVICNVQRFLFGWIPFSIGDIFYGFLILVIIIKTFQLFKLIFKKKLTRKYFIAGLQQMIFFFLFLYVVFNLLWGLNYNRKGIAAQLGLEVKQYSLADLDTLTTTIQNRLNEYAALVNEEQRDSLNKKKNLFNGSVEAYRYAAKQYPFLKYSSKSIKPSLFSYAGNYLGFQGYYNPFSGEAQVNTTFLTFLEPYVTAHEMAHQLGYAKENEANFAGFLACKLSPSNGFRYSTYFDIYNYAIGEINKRDSLLAKEFQKKLHPQALKDIAELREFYRTHRNKIESVIMWFYGEYLKANNQPAGKQTYNDVVMWLIAYYKKFGIDAL